MILNAESWPTLRVKCGMLAEAKEEYNGAKRNIGHFLCQNGSNKTLIIHTIFYGGVVYCLDKA